MLERSYEMVSLKEIKPNPEQPRREFDEEGIKSLAETIKSIGLLNPISLLKNKEGYTIIGGERRFRAYHLLGKEKIEATIYDNVDEEIKLLIEGSIAENAIRKDLNEKEVRKNIVYLHEDKDYSFAEIGKIYGYNASWVSILYQIATDEEFEKLLDEKKVSASYYEGVPTFNSSYANLKKILYKAIENKNWKNHRALRNFIFDCKRENLPSEIVKSYILHPTLFTKKVREKLTELTIEETLNITSNFVKMHESDEMPDVSEELILGYLESKQIKSEEKKRMAELRELLAKEEEKEEKRLQELEKEYQSKINAVHKKAEEEFKRKKNLIEKEMANIHTEGEIKLTPQQEAELKKLEKEYRQKKKKQEELKIKKQKEVEQQHVNRLQETKKLLTEIEEKWEQESYVNPIKDEIHHVAHQLLLLSGIPQNWEKYNLTQIVEEMPQIEFEGICRDVDSIIEKCKSNLESYESLKVHLDRRSNNPIRAIVSREKQKQKLKVVESKN